MQADQHRSVLAGRARGAARSKECTEISAYFHLSVRGTPRAGTCRPRSSPRKLTREKPGQTLQATALVHEASIRLVDTEKVQHWRQSRCALRSDDTEALESGNCSRVELMVASIQTRVEPRGHCPDASVDETEARKDAGHAHAVGGTEPGDTSPDVRLAGKMTRRVER